MRLARPLSRILSAVIGAVLLACGPGTERHSLERIRLEPLDGAALERAVVKVVARRGVPGDLAPWTVEPPTYELVREPVGADGTERNGVYLLEPGLYRIWIPGPFDRATFEHVELALRSESIVTIYAWLRREDGGVQHAASRLVSRPSAEVELIDIDFSHVEAAATPYDRLELSLRIRRATTVFGVDLIRVPPPARLPQLASGAALFPIRDDARRCVGLSTRVPLTGHFDVPHDGVLAVSFGWPPDVIEAEVRLRLEVRVEGRAGRTVERRYAVPRNDWRQVRIDLSELGQTSATATFVLHTSGDGESLCALGIPEVYTPRTRPSTVLLAISDTHRYDHMGSSKRAVDARTPVLDELAQRGVVFDNCYSPANVTLPSHVAVMTGVHPRDTRVLTNYSPISSAAVTLAERFRDAGYRTLAVVSTRHLGDPDSGLGQGFDRMSWPTMDDFARDAGDSIDALVSWISDCEDQPLFVWLHLFDAHMPYDAPEEFLRLHYPQERDPASPKLPEPTFPLPVEFEGVRDVDYLRAIYRAEISYLDDRLRRVFDIGRLREGVIAFTADHGEGLGEHGVWWSHSGLYPDSLHVPLILRWPDGPVGVREARGVSLVDLPRTLLDLAGLGHAEFPGVSLATFDDPTETERFAISSAATDASITAGSWHFILALRAHTLGAKRYGDRRYFEQHQAELYDLSTDPTCSNDLLAAEHATAARLRSRLITWLLEAQDLGVRADGNRDQETLGALAELGYAAAPEGDDDADLFDPACECAQCELF